MTYKDYPVKSLGSSDVARLIYDSPDSIGRIQYMKDGSYNAYIVDESADIPDSYVLVASGRSWLKIYDDTEAVYSSGRCEEWRIYRRGDFGTIVQVIHSEKRKALATIDTDAGIMVIYFNGSNEYLTAEAADTVETIEDAKPENIEQSEKLIGHLYGDPVWRLCWLGEEARYTIKDEFLDAWGVTESDAAVSGAEIVRLADEWGVSIEKLMEQVEA